MLTLDHLEGVRVPDEQDYQQVFALRCLSIGILDLYNSVQNFELAVQDYEHQIGKRIEFLEVEWDKFGLDPAVDYLLPCYFHWSANTLCNYARLVGVFKALHDGEIDYSELVQNGGSSRIKKFCENYVKSIHELAEVVNWRNKVSAHFAITDPFKSDKSMLLQSAGFDTVGYRSSRFRTESYIVSLNTDESLLPSWSLTEKYEKLAPRFWPRKA